MEMLDDAVRGPLCEALFHLEMVVLDRSGEAHITGDEADLRTYAAHLLIQMVLNDGDKSVDFDEVLEVVRAMDTLRSNPQ